MQKLLKENKGFSLVELLIALLIMAVIAGTAITLFGGVLNTSKVGADRETAEAIRRAILTYMNASNDTDLSALGSTTAAGYNAQDLVDMLAQKIKISKSGGTYTVEYWDESSSSWKSSYGSLTLVGNDEDLEGIYGPFLEKTGIKPTQENTGAWDIDINKSTQVITVKATDTDKINIH